jgi:PAS domain S-box-containing protein
MLATATSTGADLPQWLGTSAEVEPTRRTCAMAALFGLAGAALYAVHPTVPTASARGVLVGGMLLLTLISLALGWGVRRPQLAPAVLGIAIVASATLVTAALLLGHGPFHVALGLLPLLVTLVSITVGVRAGIMLAVASALAITAIGWMAWRLPGMWRNDSPVWMAAITQALMLGVGLEVGLTYARLLERRMQLVADREQRFAGLLGIAADWYWELDEHLRFTHFHEESAGLARLGKAARLGRHPWEVPIGLSPEALDAHRADLEQHLPFRNLIVRRTDDEGMVHHLAVNGQPRFDARGRFLGYWGVGRDVTAEVRASQAIAASEQRYRELFALTPSPLLLHREGRVIDANPAALALFGYPDLESMQGVDVLTHYDDAQESRLRAARRIAQIGQLPVGQTLAPTDFVLRSRSGRRIYVRGTGARVQTPGGAAVLSVYHDDTERRIAEEAVRRSEALLAQLVEHSPDVITLSELDSGRYTMVNEAFCRTSGYGRDEAIGRTVHDLGLWQDPGQRELLVRALGEHDRVEDFVARFVRKNGEPLTVLMSASRFTMDGRDYLAANARDITAAERTRLEYEAILRHASVGIALTRRRRFVRVNEQFARMFGGTAEAYVDGDTALVWPDADEYERMRQALRAQQALGRPLEADHRMRRRDGSEFTCRLLAQSIDPTRPDTGTIWIAEDVTERRRVEKELQEAYGAAQAASRAKSAFLANTSHEIRTPLNGLLGLARLAQRNDIDEVKRREYVDQMAESAQTLAEIISDTLDLAKIEAGKLTLERVTFDLPETTRALHRAYQSLAVDRGLDLRLELDARVPTHVAGDPVRVRQIVGNYLSNALKFTPAGDIVLRLRALPGERVRFEVQDSGPGIEPDVQRRLFQPFTQADDSITRRHTGTGLGLSICRQLAALMGGEVGVISEPGDGSLFWAELPLPAAPHAEPPGPRAAADDDAQLRGRRVLVVEDNPVNMLICCTMLEQGGMRVAQAENGERALASVDAARAAGDPFDAVLMDVQMPVMSGYDAARALRQRPHARELPVIALTAAALVSEREQALAAGMDAFLTKPVEPQQLRRTLADVLRKRA